MQCNNHMTKKVSSEFDYVKYGSEIGVFLCTLHGWIFDFVRKKMRRWECIRMWCMMLNFYHLKQVIIWFHFIFSCRGDRQRLGSAIAAYLEYLNICASSYAHRNGLSNEDSQAQNAIARNWLDLDIFSMKKFLEDIIGPLRVPSHRRYLQYFSGLLSGKIRINSHPLYLRFITIESPPSWLQHEPIALQQSEWRSFIKIYEGLNCVFTSGKLKHYFDWGRKKPAKCIKDTKSKENHFTF